VDRGIDALGVDDVGTGLWPSRLTTVLAVSISGNRARASLWLALASCFVETGPRLGRSAGSIDVREAGHVSS
jgi:hypothetical protein